MAEGVFNHVPDLRVVLIGVGRVLATRFPLASD